MTLQYILFNHVNYKSRVKKNVVENMVKNREMRASQKQPQVELE